MNNRETHVNPSTLDNSPSECKSSFLLISNLVVLKALDTSL